MWQILLRQRDGTIRTYRTVTDENGAIQIAAMLYRGGQEHVAIKDPEGQLYHY